MFFANRKVIVALMWLGLVWTAGLSECRADRLVDRDRARLLERRSEILQNLRFELRQLSNQCFENGQRTAAEDVTTISMRITSPPANPVFPRMIQLPTGERVSEADRVWRNRLQNLRVDRASDLYRLARSALKAKLPSLAYRLIMDTLVVDPDHKYARSIVGDKKFIDERRKEDPLYEGEWVSPFEAAQRSGRSPKVNHPKFGWLPVKYVSRYEQGERLFKGKWMSSTREAEIRRQFTNAWEVRTEHFLIKTNTSLEEGVVVARKLERFHEWLTNNFAAFFDTPAALVSRFEQATSRSRSVSSDKPMEVHYYSNRDEYDRVIRRRNPAYATLVTNGLYWEPDQTSYFFRKDDEEQNDSTIYHEATHQILDLATLRDRNNAARKRRLVLRERKVRPWVLAERSNFWLLEGIACYFESFEVKEGQVTLGDPNYVRFVTAQHRLFEDNFYVPFVTFCGMGRDQFQTHANFRQLYSQSSGVVHFLMEYKGGQYKDDFVTLLNSVYRPDLANVNLKPSLQEITGVDFSVLDQQYREHMSDVLVAIQMKQAGK